MNISGHAVRCGHRPKRRRYLIALPLCPWLGNRVHVRWFHLRCYPAISSGKSSVCLVQRSTGLAPIWNSRRADLI